MRVPSVSFQNQFNVQVDENISLHPYYCCHGLVVYSPIILVNWDLESGAFLPVQQLINLVSSKIIRNFIAESSETGK